MMSFLSHLCNYYCVDSSNSENSITEPVLEARRIAVVNSGESILFSFVKNFRIVTKLVSNIFIH